MNSGSKIKFVQPLTWKAKDETKVDEYLKVFVNPLAEWFDEVPMGQVGSMFVPVYFLDWLNSQLAHGTFHPEVTVYGVFAVDRLQSEGNSIDASEVIINITSEYSPHGRVTTFRVKEIDFSAILYEDKFIYSWGHKTLFADQAKEITRCINAKGESLWVESTQILRQEKVDRCSSAPGSIRPTGRCWNTSWRPSRNPSRSIEGLAVWPMSTCRIAPSWIS